MIQASGSARFHPWRRLRDLGPSWKLVWRDDLPRDMYGFTRWADQTIHMRAGMTFEERRCTIAHEVQHVLRGLGSGCDVVAEEAIVDRRVSRLLIPSADDLADALAWANGRYEEAARELWVDPWTLEVRLSTLRASEQALVDARLGEIELLRADG